MRRHRDRRRGTLARVGTPVRWLTPVGLVVIALVVLAAGLGQVGFGTSGARLELLVSCAVYAVAGAFVVSTSTPRPLSAALLLLAAAAATAAIHHGDPSGPIVAIYLVMAFAPLRLGMRPAVAIAVGSVAAFDAELLFGHATPVVFMAAIDGGAMLFFLMGTLLRREHEQRARADQLLRELERSKEAERRAVALAERARMARDMHDVLAHTLSGLALYLSGVSLLARRGDRDELVTSVDRAQTLARDGLAEARDVISTLRGETLPGPEGLSRLASEHRRLGGTCELVVAGRALVLDNEAGVALYRTAQEALSNVRKHAPAARVKLGLTYTDEEAVLVVQDSGCGENPAPPAVDGYGLTGMSERAALVGGHLTMGPANGGFRVELRVPRGAAA